MAHKFKIISSLLLIIVIQYNLCSKDLIAIKEGNYAIRKSKLSLNSKNPKHPEFLKIIITANDSLYQLHEQKLSEIVKILILDSLNQVKTQSIIRRWHTKNKNNLDPEKFIKNDYSTKIGIKKLGKNQVEIKFPYKTVLETPKWGILSCYDLDFGNYWIVIQLIGNNNIPFSSNRCLLKVI